MRAAARSESGPDPRRGARFRRQGHPAVASPAEDSPSGLWRSLGKRVGLTPSGVRIPYPPPLDAPGSGSGVAHARKRTGTRRPAGHGRGCRPRRRRPRRRGPAPSAPARGSGTSGRGLSTFPHARDEVAVVYLHWGWDHPGRATSWFGRSRRSAGSGAGRGHPPTTSTSPRRAGERGGQVSCRHPCRRSRRPARSPCAVGPARTPRRHGGRPR